MKSLEKSNPELFKAMSELRELTQKSHELVRQYRQAAATERDKIKAQVQEAVGKQFDAHVAPAPWS